MTTNHGRTTTIMAAATSTDDSDSGVDARYIVTLPAAQAAVTSFPPGCPVLFPCPLGSVGAAAAAATTTGDSPPVRPLDELPGVTLGTVESIFLDLRSLEHRGLMHRIRDFSNNGVVVAETALRYAPQCPVWVRPEALFADADTTTNAAATSSDSCRPPADPLLGMVLYGRQRQEDARTDYGVLLIGSTQFREVHGIAQEFLQFRLLPRSQNVNNNIVSANERQRQQESSSSAAPPPLPPVEQDEQQEQNAVVDGGADNSTTRFQEYQETAIAPNDDDDDMVESYDLNSVGDELQQQQPQQNAVGDGGADNSTTQIQEYQETPNDDYTDHLEENNDPNSDGDEQQQQASGSTTTEQHSTLHNNCSRDTRRDRSDDRNNWYDHDMARRILVPAWVQNHELVARQLVSHIAELKQRTEFQCCFQVLGKGAQKREEQPPPLYRNRLYVLIKPRTQEPGKNVDQQGLAKAVGMVEALVEKYCVQDSVTAQEMPPNDDASTSSSTGNLRRRRRGTRGGASRSKKPRRQAEEDVELRITIDTHYGPAHDENEKAAKNVGGSSVSGVAQLDPSRWVPPRTSCPGHAVPPPEEPRRPETPPGLL